MNVSGITLIEKNHRRNRTIDKDGNIKLAIKHTFKPMRFKSVALCLSNNFCNKIVGNKTDHNYPQENVLKIVLKEHRISGNGITLSPSNSNSYFRIRGSNAGQVIVLYRVLRLQDADPSGARRRDEALWRSRKAPFRVTSVLYTNPLFCTAFRLRKTSA